MAWSGLTLTMEGRNALSQAQISNRMNIKSIVVGDGAPPANFTTLKGLVHQLYEITELRVDATKEGCTLTADFPQVDYDYYFRELGVVITTDEGDILYVYDNSADDAQYIVSSTGAETLQKRLRLSLIISDVANIELSTPSNLYVDYRNFEGHTGDAVRHITEDEREKWNDTLNNAKEYSNETYQQATGYTDLKIAQLINGAPETLDTLKEVADAIKENETVVDALDAAIGTKAGQTELDAHAGNSTIHITAAERTNWNSKANGSHTHNYAGSSSAGGTANSAVKLQTARTITIGKQSQSFDGTKNITFDEKSMGLLAIKVLQVKAGDFATIKCQTASDGRFNLSKYFFMVVNNAAGMSDSFYSWETQTQNPFSIGSSSAAVTIKFSVSNNYITYTLSVTTAGVANISVIYDAANVEVTQL